MRVLRFEITPEDAGKKIEWYLRGDKGISRRVVITLKNTPDGITLNGRHARTIDLLSAGDVLEIRLPEPASRMRKSTRTAGILYEDKDVLVYDKPADMPCHPSGCHFNDTLANVYAAHCAEQGLSGTFRPINRLDKDTTGAVVVAKNQIAAGILWKKVNKRYLALVQGDVAKDAGVIDLPIEREQPYEQLRIVSPDGQRAVTHYRVLGRAGGHSLVECTLETGRTHQIRVHFSYLGHPLAGDTLYGGATDVMQRQGLHCGWVGFPHPVTGEQLEFDAPLHDDMKTALKMLGFSLDMYKNK